MIISLQMGSLVKWSHEDAHAKHEIFLILINLENIINFGIVFSISDNEWESKYSVKNVSLL